MLSKSSFCRISVLHARLPSHTIPPLVSVVGKFWREQILKDETFESRLRDKRSLIDITRDGGVGSPFEDIPNSGCSRTFQAGGLFHAISLRNCFALHLFEVKLLIDGN